MRRKPRTETTHRQICQLQSDNHTTKEGWILLDGAHVVLAQQRHGEAPTGSVYFSRRAFHALIDWYNRDQDSP